MTLLKAFPLKKYFFLNEIITEILIEKLKPLFYKKWKILIKISILWSFSFFFEWNARFPGVCNVSYTEKASHIIHEIQYSLVSNQIKKKINKSSLQIRYWIYLFSNYLQRQEITIKLLGKRRIWSNFEKFNKAQDWINFFIRFQRNLIKAVLQIPFQTHQKLEFFQLNRNFSIKLFFPRTHIWIRNFPHFYKKIIWKSWLLIKHSTQNTWNNSTDKWFRWMMMQQKKKFFFHYMTICSRVHNWVWKTIGFDSFLKLLENFECNLIEICVALVFVRAF